MVSCILAERSGGPDGAADDRPLLRALSSITSAQGNALADLARGNRVWSVEDFDDYDGYRSILLEPDVAAVPGPFYLVTGVARCLELFEASELGLVSLGRFDDIGPLLARLHPLLLDRENGSCPPVTLGTSQSLSRTA